MFSFYSLPSTVLDSAKHGTLEAAYLFYYATDVPFRHSPSSGANSSSHTAAASSATGHATEAEASTSGSSTSVLEAWQKTSMTRLTPEEIEDEANVTRWDLESADIKAALRKRLNQLVGDMLIIAKQVRRAPQVTQLWAELAR